MIGEVTVGGIVVSGERDNTLNANLLLNSLSYKLAIFRTFLGTTSIRKLSDSAGSAQELRFVSDTGQKRTMNCTQSPANKDNTKSTLKRFDVYRSEYLDSSISRNGLGQYFSKSLPNNTEFYKRLLAEISYAVYYRKKSPVTAFLHIYRALEVMSFALPMVYYSVKRNDFIGGFQELSKLFSGSEKSELPFFKRYLEKIQNEQQFFGVRFDVEVLSDDAQNKRASTLYIKELCRELKLKKGADEIIIDKQSDTINMSLLGVHHLLVTLRNRVFHNCTGEEKNNLKLHLKITDYEEIFISLNDVFLNWLGLIFADFITSDIKNS